MKKIVVLIHKRDTGFSSANYLVKLLMKESAGMGFATALMRGVDRVVPADLVVLMWT